MRGRLARVRILWRGLRRPSQLDADMHDEMRFHLDMEAQRIMRQQGVDTQEARRRAALAFGGVEKYRGAARDVLGLTWARGLSVDLKLGTRMLAKYPGLTVVAVLALSLAIGAGAAYLEFVTDLLHGQLPFDEGDRVAGIQNWDQQTGDPENRSTADFVAWRGALTSFEDLGAYRALDRNLITNDGRAEPVRGVEISAAAFRIARVPPLLGRPLVPEDERTGAPPVAVIGHDIWVTRFASDPTVVGRAVRLGGTPHTIVGVMPEGFGFPVSHSLWVPLPLNDAHYPPRQRTAIKIFGRLAPGVTMDDAQAELSAIALRTTSEFPDTHRHLRPVVKPYVQSLWSAAEDALDQRIVFYGANLFFIGLLAVCGANIATLVFARTATRDVEISVRTALGASRARIAGQLFAEALVLSAVAAAIGLLAAVYGLQWVKHTITVAQGNRLMFWWNDQLSPTTIAYAATLAVGAALIVGVIPALKATGRRVQDRLKQSTGGALSAGLRFGGVWTAVIVAQVALTVIFLAIAGTLSWGRYFSNAGDRELSFPAAQYIAMRVSLDREAPSAFANADQTDAQFRNRVRATYQQLEQRLTAEPGIAGVTYATRLPGMSHSGVRVEVAGATSHIGPDGGPWVQTASTGVGFFETFHVLIVAGRSFTDADLSPGRHVAIVDQTFVRHVLGGRDAVGVQFRKVANKVVQFRDEANEDTEPAPWIEIVGVVADLTVGGNKKVGDSVVYRPVPPESTSPFHLAVHVNGDASAMMARLRTIAVDVDPSLRIEDLKTFEQVSATDRVALEFFAHLLAGIGAVALLLATAGVYALMSFTVARRTAEIGIRIALGANPRRIVLSTFSRALAQMALGVLVGSIPAGLIVANLAPEVSAGAGMEAPIAVCVAVAVFMAAVTTVACIVPASHALRIQPTDALKTT